MTVRNIRAHQARGLIPGPDLVGRTGYYGAEHIARLEMVKDLQAKGFNLEGIRQLLANAGDATEDAVGFTQELRRPFAAEPPRETTFDELLERWGDLADLKVLRRASSLGLIRSLGGSRLEERSPQLSAAGIELARIGVSADKALDVVEVIQRHVDAIAEAYVRLFLEEIWQPFEAAGQPPERWPEVREALEHLRPLASQAVVAVFGLAMGDRVDEAFGREAERLAEGAQQDHRSAS
jgi:DNA-binding transcriptional MerR regulator